MGQGAKSMEQGAGLNVRSSLPGQCTGQSNIVPEPQEPGLPGQDDPEHADQAAGQTGRLQGKLPVLTPGRTRRQKSARWRPGLNSSVIRQLGTRASDAIYHKAVEGRLDCVFELDGVPIAVSAKQAGKLADSGKAQLHAGQTGVEPRFFGFALEDLADILGITDGAMDLLLAGGAVDPTDLRSIMVAYHGIELARMAREVEAELKTRPALDPTGLTDMKSKVAALKARVLDQQAAATRDLLQLERGQLRKEFGRVERRERRRRQNRYDLYASVYERNRADREAFDRGEPVRSVLPDAEEQLDGGRALRILALGLGLDRPK